MHLYEDAVAIYHLYPKHKSALACSSSIKLRRYVVPVSDLTHSAFTNSTIHFHRHAFVLFYPEEYSGT